MARAYFLGLLLLIPSAARGQKAASGFKAAAGKVDITPDLSRHKIYMAGYDATGRRPRGVHDSLYARVLVVSDGTRTAAVVGVDWLGLYRNDVQDIRRLAGFESPERYLFVSATHQHSGPDSMGLWGRFPGVSGRDARYHEEAKRLIAAEVKRLAAQLEPAELAGVSRRVDPSGLCRDSRDPVVIDPHLGVLQVRRPGGKVLATLVNWSCHPEVLGRDNFRLTADYPGPLCAVIEERTGGECVFLPGAIGGLMTPDTRGRENFYESYRIGAALAEMALQAAKAPAAAARAGAVRARAKTVLVQVENPRYLAFLPALTFGHDLFDARGRRLPRRARWTLALRHILTRGLKPGLRPWVESEVSVLDLGPARLLGIPGEIFPELVIGGYDGRYTGRWPLITEGNPDPPDLSKAPKGPYLRDQIRAPVPLVAGLANDALGYILPEYDFKRRDNLTLLPRLPGHHYEETNSIGAGATQVLTEAARDLLKEARP